MKEVSSTEGMQLSLKTSELLALKLQNDFAQKHINQLSEALNQKDFDTFSKIVMQESN